MNRNTCVAGPVLLGLLVAATGLAAQEITMTDLLRESWDLERLSRMPTPGYKTVQFSSYDRRSTTPDKPDWFSNSDGFGGEPIPGFEKVLEKPGEDGIGRYLVCDVKGPGALVRGWTAAINGTFKVFLDGEETPFYDGSADAFLRRRLDRFLKEIDVNLWPENNTFQQEDADYFPITFGKGLRIEWTGNLEKLHFYQIGVRLYPEGTAVKTFRLSQLRSEIGPDVLEALAQQAFPSVDEKRKASRLPIDWTIPAGERRSVSQTGGGAVYELALRAEAEDLRAALRGTLLTIRFDGASVPQVEAPLGDFFGAAPGVNPYESLPMEVEEDGAMICRFVMPFRESMKLALLNTTERPVRVTGAIRTGDYDWDPAHSMYFRAHWRVDHGLYAGNEPDEVKDMPYLMALGQGRFVGAALTVVNPCPCPMAWGNWWGEGDEKIFVDGEARPSTIGTGSEDYFNYSWSHPRLFECPYTVQPLVSGPDHRGYVTNIRWHVLDDLPFTTSLEFLMELWHHTPTRGLSYARIGYHYGRPGLRDDHPPLARGDLIVPALPPWTPMARYGSAGATFYQAESLWVRKKENAEVLEAVEYAGGKAVRWKPSAAGAQLRLDFRVEKKRSYTVVLTCGCSPEGGKFKAYVDDKPLEKGGRDKYVVDLSTAFQARITNFTYRRIPLEPGVRTLTLEAVGEQPGEIVLDFFWIKP